MGLQSKHISHCNTNSNVTLYPANDS